VISDQGLQMLSVLVYHYGVPWAGRLWFWRLPSG
jgi:hypothetical protein